jgi:putative SOS response-associated peptidase YedK
MPAILAPRHWDAWLARTPLAPADVAEMLAPCPEAWLEAHQVSPRVNAPAHDAPDCIEPAAG